jgi:hypothetical protein
VEAEFWEAEARGGGVLAALEELAREEEAPPAVGRDGSRTGKLGLVPPDAELDLDKPAWLIPEGINDGPSLRCGVVVTAEAGIVPGSRESALGGPAGVLPGAVSASEERLGSRLGGPEDLLDERVVSAEAGRSGGELPPEGGFPPDDMLERRDRGSGPRRLG